MAKDRRVCERLKTLPGNARNLSVGAFTRAWLRRDSHAAQTREKKKPGQPEMEGWRTLAGDLRR